MVLTRPESRVGLPGPARPAAVPAWRARRPLVVGWAAFAASFVLEMVAVLRADHTWLVHRLPDDGFYYLEIARRIAAGQGATFDGITATNGFHPLWELLLAGAARVIGGGDALVRTALILGILFLLAALLIVQRLLRNVVGEGPALVAVLFAAHPLTTFTVTADGMEGGLVVLALALVAVTLQRALRTGRLRDTVLLGVALGGLVLARIDFAVVAPAVALVPAWRAGRLRPAALTAAAGALTLLPWVVWSELSVGHLLPVSGYLKLHELARDTASRFGGRFTPAYGHFVLSSAASYVGSVASGLAFAGWRPGAVLIEVMALGGAAVVLRRRMPGHRPDARGWPPGGVALGAVAAMTALKGATDVVTLPYWAGSWYSAPQRVLLGLVVGLACWALVREACRRSRVLGAVLALVALAAVTPGVVGDVADSASSRPAVGNWQDANDLAAAWIRRHPTSDRYGSTDSGLIGFEADPQPVVNLDGLVNSYAYAHALLAGASGLRLYRMEGVRRLVERGVPGDGRVPTCARPLWHSPWSVRYGGGLDDSRVTEVPVGIFDLGSC